VARTLRDMGWGKRDIAPQSILSLVLVVLLASAVGGLVWPGEPSGGEARPGFLILLGGLIGLTGVRLIRSEGRERRVRDLLGREIEALRQSEERFRIFVDSVPDYALIMLDRAGRITSWNAGAERLTGWRADEILGAGLERIYPQAGDFVRIGGVAPPANQQREQGWWVHRDGHRFRGEVVMTPLLADAAGVVGFGIVTRDITAQSEPHVPLLVSERSARSEAERASLRRDRLLASVAHELRSPLSAILSAVEMLRRHPGDRARVLETAAVIERSARAQVRTLGDLVDLSRLRTGGLRLKAGLVNLDVPVWEALARMQPLLEERRQHVVTHFSDPAPTIEGDSRRLRQIVESLLRHAVRASPPGSILEVRVDRTESRCVLEVIDAAAGMGPEVRRDLLQPADAVTGAAVLEPGLAVARQLVELHGGELTAASRSDGGGSTLRVTLPVCPPSLVGAPQAGHIPGSGEALRGVRVLLVEDNDDSRELFKHILEESGAVVRTAGSAGEALTALDQGLPDLLLSDIGLPDLDGYQLLADIRRRWPEGGGRLPAIALTAFAGPEDRRRALIAGYQLHLAKPVEPAHLVRGVQQLLSAGEATSALVAR